MFFGRVFRLLSNRVNDRGCRWYEMETLQKSATTFRLYLCTVTFQRRILSGWLTFLKLDLGSALSALNFCQIQPAELQPAELQPA